MDAFLWSLVQWVDFSTGERTRFLCICAAHWCCSRATRFGLAIITMNCRPSLKLESFSILSFQGKRDITLLLVWGTSHLHAVILVWLCFFCTSLCFRLFEDGPSCVGKMALTIIWWAFGGLSVWSFLRVVGFWPSIWRAGKLLYELFLMWFESLEYFQLIRQSPIWLRYLSLGRRWSGPVAGIWVLHWKCMRFSKRPPQRFWFYNSF